ncbi:hypothetical protein [Alkalispirochaeta americana]|nr:hypothetical protein [Alkalispirochaeta americana]
MPATVRWYLADLGEFKGRQEMLTRRASQKLQALWQHALVESTVSSNRIEGVEIDQSRINTVVFGPPHLRDRDEEEVREYRQALSRIHDDGDAIPITEKTVLDLHRLVRGDTWDAGAYKEYEQRLSDVGNGRGNKTELILQAIAKKNQSFSISGIRDRCLEVSLEMVRRILKRLRDDKRIQSTGRGHNARWRKTVNW